MSEQKPCFLCTAPVPATQDDANFAYLAGVADGVAMTVHACERKPLCEAHARKLADILRDVYGLELRDSARRPGGAHVQIGDGNTQIIFGRRPRR